MAKCLTFIRGAQLHVCNIGSNEEVILLALIVQLVGRDEGPRNEMKEKGLRVIASNLH